MKTAKKKEHRTLQNVKKEGRKKPNEKCLQSRTNRGLWVENSTVRLGSEGGPGTSEGFAGGWPGQRKVGGEIGELDKGGPKNRGQVLGYETSRVKGGVKNAQEKLKLGTTKRFLLWVRELLDRDVMGKPMGRILGGGRRGRTT